MIQAATVIGWIITVFAFCWLLDRERQRHHEALQMLQRQLVALADKDASYVAESEGERPPGKVTYMDDERMAALDANRT